jgi:cellulose biosynthesis protein BcsQ
VTERTVVGTLKGGVGKSTTVSQLAIWMALLGLGPVFVGDADTDLTTYEWIMAVREKLLEMSGGRANSRLDAFDLTGGRTKRLHELERSYPHSIIDVEPKRDKLLRETLWRPDTDQKTNLVMPMKPYPPDVRKLPQTLELAGEVDRHNPVFPRVLLVQVRLRAGHSTDVPRQLSEAGIPQFKTMIRLKESIGYSLGTTLVDPAYAEVLTELGINPIRKDKN